MIIILIKAITIENGEVMPTSGIIPHINIFKK